VVLLTSTSAIAAGTVVPRQTATPTPRPTAILLVEGGPGEGLSFHPAFSAAAIRHSVTRLLLFKWRRRNCTASTPAAVASSSINDSTAKTRGGSPGERNGPVRSGVGSSCGHGAMAPRPGLRATSYMGAAPLPPPPVVSSEAAKLRPLCLS